MDDMEEVRQRFAADVADYVADIEAAAEEARNLARANEEAKIALDALRDKAAETAAVLSRMKDEEHKAADAAGRFEWLSVMLGRVRDKAAEAAFAFNELKKEERDAAGAGLLAKLGGLAGGIPMGGGMFSLPALLAIIPAIEALLPLVVGLVSGFAAAGAGAGAFAILALPAFKSVSSAYQQISTDQQAYDRALTATAKSNALKHLKADYAALSPAQRDALGGVQQLAGEWRKMSTAFTPEAMKVFSGVLRLANELLPDITPFAKTFADALTGLLGKAGQFAGSQGFKDWLKQFHSLEGPSITAIGDGIGKVAKAIGGLLTVMSKKDVVNAINIAFTIIAGTITIVTGMIKRLMDNWDGMSVAAKHTWYDIKQWSHDVSKAFDAVRHFVAEMAHDAAAWFDFMRHHAAILAHNIAAHFSEIRHDIARWADDTGHYVMVVVHWFERLPGWILHAISGLAGMLYSGGRRAIESLLDGARSMLGSALNTVEGWGHDLANAMMHPFGIHFSEPSQATQMIKAGQNIDAALLLGLQSGIPQLTKMATDLGNAVKEAVTGKLISPAEGDSLLTWLAAGNSRLKTLARERQNIVDTINAERKFAASTASAVAGNFALSGFATSGLNGGAATVGQIIGGLRLDVGAIRRWAHNIHKLAREGLNRNYLGQLIGLGPVDGAALVQELANAGLGDIKAINSAEFQISEVSGQVGKLAASAMYDTASAAGKGFLVGLLEQKKAITQLMESIAKSMIAVLKKELHVSTPGAAGGYALAGSGGFAGGSGGHATVNITANFAPGMGWLQSPQFRQYLQQEMQEATLRYAQMNPGNGLTPQWGH